jgi:hypothetical protein
MATNLVQSLDQSQAQLFCKYCEDNGAGEVPLIREMHVAKCCFGHIYSSIGEAVARGCRMIPMPLNEQPPITSVKFVTWCHPKIKELLEQKYRGRLIATLDSVYSALADGAVMIVAGADVLELKKMGIRNGTEMLAAIKSMKQSDRERDEAVRELDKLKELLRQVGVGG